MNVPSSRRPDSASDLHDSGDFGSPKTPVVVLLQHDEAISDLITEALESEGCDFALDLAPTGKEDTSKALELVTSKKADIVVFDVVQPLGPSVEAFKAFRKAAEAKGRHFLVTTSDKEGLRGQGLDGAVRLLEPDDVEKVADAVRAALTELDAASSDA